VNRFDSTLLTRASRKVSNRTAMVVQPNKAIVGANVFAHEAGIHTDGVLKHAETYEIMKPESVGLLTNNLVLGKHSGKSAFKKRLADLGFTLTESQVESALNRIKLLADEKKEITDADIEAVVLDEIESHSAVEVDVFQSARDDGESGQEHGHGHREGLEQERVGTKVALGSGPVDATFKRLSRSSSCPTSSRVSTFTASPRALTPRAK
jgi:2-isopropylmalate synthase